MGEVSLAQSWSSHFIGKGSLGIACVVPLLHSGCQGPGFLQHSEGINGSIEPKQNQGSWNTHNDPEKESKFNNAASV